MGISSIIKEFRKAKSAINSFKGTLAKLKSINYEGVISSELLRDQYDLARQNLQNRSKNLKNQLSASNLADRYSKRKPSDEVKMLTYPLSEPINNSIGFIVENFDGGSSGVDKAQSEIKTTSSVGYDIQLYIPDGSVVSNASVTYTKKGFGPGVRIFSDFLKNLTSMDGSGLMQNGASAMSVIGDKVIDTLTGGYANFKYGRARNPMEEMTLEGIEFRTHSFEFSFFPKNAEEAKEVRRICHVFRQTMLPATYSSLFSGQDEKGNNLADYAEEMPFFRYPHQFRLEWRGPIAKNIEGFLPCFLTGCKISHSDDQLGYYEDGTPLFTTLSLEFQEKEILTLQNYNNLVAPKAVRDTGRQGFSNL